MFKFILLLTISLCNPTFSCEKASFTQDNPDEIILPDPAKSAEVIIPEILEKFAYESKAQACELLKRIPELRELTKGKRVLDVGAAVGYKARVIQESGAQVYCIEPAEEFANFIKDNNIIPENRVYQTVIEKMPSPTWGTFDVVTSFYTPVQLWCFPNRAFSFFSAVYKMLKDNGVLIATFSHKDNQTQQSCELFVYQDTFKLFFPNYKKTFRLYEAGNDFTVVIAKKETLDFNKLQNHIYNPKSLDDLTHQLSVSKLTQGRSLSEISARNTRECHKLLSHIPELHELKGQRALNIGSETGEKTLKLLELGADAGAIATDFESYEYSVTKYPVLFGRILPTAPIEKELFDAVTCFNVTRMKIVGSEKTYRFYKSICDMLKPAGKVILSYSDREESKEKQDQDLHFDIIKSLFSDVKQMKRETPGYIGSDKTVVIAVKTALDGGKQSSSVAFLENN